FYHDTPSTEISTLSLHDAFPISGRPGGPGRASYGRARPWGPPASRRPEAGGPGEAGRASWWGAPGEARPSGGDRVSRAARRWAQDRKSTRLNSSHLVISYAAFCF